MFPFKDNFSFASVFPLSLLLIRTNLPSKICLRWKGGCHSGKWHLERSHVASARTHAWGSQPDPLQGRLQHVLLLGRLCVGQRRDFPPSGPCPWGVPTWRPGGCDPGECVMRSGDYILVKTVPGAGEKISCFRLGGSHFIVWFLGRETGGQKKWSGHVRIQDLTDGVINLLLLILGTVGVGKARGPALLGPAGDSSQKDRNSVWRNHLLWILRPWSLCRLRM